MPVGKYYRKCVHGCGVGTEFPVLADILLACPHCLTPYPSGVVGK